LPDLGDDLGNDGDLSVFSVRELEGVGLVVEDHLLETLLVKVDPVVLRILGGAVHL